MHQFFIHQYFLAAKSEPEHSRLNLRISKDEQISKTIFVNIILGRSLTQKSASELIKVTKLLGTVRLSLLAGFREF